MTTSIKEEHSYKTVDNKAAKTLTLPANSTIWIVKVEGSGDDQIKDRCLHLCLEESEEQDKRIRDYQNKIAIDPDWEIDSWTQEVSRKIWDFMPNDAVVVIPYAEDIIQEDVANRRLFDRFQDTIKASAIMAASHRHINPKGYYEANISDLKNACSVFNAVISGVAGSKEGIPKSCQKFLFEYLSKLPTGTYTYGELQKVANISPSTLSKHLHGRKNPYGEIQGGLLEFCPAIELMDKNMGDGRYHSILWDRDAYKKWLEKENTLFAMDPERQRYWEEYESRY